MRIFSWAILLSCVLMTSCQSGVKLTSVIDLEAPLKLATLTSKETIDVHSDKWDRLVEFATNNKKGWEPTSSLFVGTEILIEQIGFSFRYYPSTEIATIKFENEEGKEFIYAKTIDQEQLSFLLN